MRFEAGFIACYALMLLGGAAGLHRLGKVDTSPWRSRALAGHRRQVPLPPEAADARTGWPHSEAGRLHTAIALVTVTAAVTLTVVEVVRHHRVVEVLVLGAVGGAAVVAAVRLARALIGMGRPASAGPDGERGIAVEDEELDTYVDLDVDVDPETLRWAGEGPAAAPAEQ